MNLEIAQNDFNRRLLGFSDDQRRLLLRRCAAEGYDFNRLPMMKRRRQGGEIAPATTAQKRLWILEQIAPSNQFNRINTALELNGAVDIETMRAAAGDIVAGHEALRTNFIENDGLLQQIIGAPEPADFTFDDFSSLDARLIESKLIDERRKFESAPLDLRHDRLFRVRLIKAAQRKYILFVALHHLIADGWSVDVIARHLSAAYAARRAGNIPESDDFAAQLADYAVWEEDLKAVGFFEKDVAWFQKELAGAPPETTLIYDFQPPAQRHAAAGIERREIGGRAYESLEKFIRERQTTWFAVLLAATAITMRRFGGNTDLTLGVALANRERADWHDTVGAFINVLPIRLRLDDEADFIRTIELTAGKAAQLLARQSIPLEEILNAAQTIHNSSRTPIFQCLFILQNANDSSLDLPEIEVVELPPASAGALYDVTFVWRQAKDGIYLDAEYAIDLYKRETIGQFLDVLMSLLESLPEIAGASVRDIARPSITEAMEFSAAGQRTETVEPETSAVEAFYEWVRRTPDAPAILSPEGALTYSEAARRVEAIAAAMRADGFAAGNAAAIAVSSGRAAALAMLAVNRAGGYFTMIDRRAGKEYVAQILSDIEPRVCLADKTGAETLGASAPVILIDDLADLAKEFASPADFDFDALKLTATAYVAYTSGSTGRPKGIVLSHRSFKQFLDWQKFAFDFASGVRVAMWSPFVFDACLTEVFGALSYGATLCIPDYDCRRDPEYILRWLAETRIDYFLTVPSFLRLLIEELERRPEFTPPIRDVAVSGEVLSASLVNRFQAVFPRAGLHNLYGPTETILGSSHLIENPFDAGERVPVGRPLAGRRIVLLDRDYLPLPSGAVGEICIVSAYLADGYLNLPEETARRFTAPLIPDSAEKVYRTGDDGRFSADGTLFFLGRGDRQVKIRGSRIELEAIENAVRNHPLVEECAVAAIEHEEDLTLVGYVVGNLNVTSGELQRFLLDKLPSYAIPTLFTTISAMPRTMTGKIDRKALPKPRFDAASALDTASDGNTQQRVSGIWTKILGAKIEAHRNFFESGGNSLLAVRLHRLLEKEFPGRVNLVDIFANPTISALAAMISEPAQPVKAKNTGRERANLRNKALRTRRRDL